MLVKAGLIGNGSISLPGKVTLLDYVLCSEKGEGASSLAYLIVVV